MYKAFMELMGDRKEHTVLELRRYIKEWFHLSNDEVKKLLPSGRKTIFANRVSWTSTYLKKAELITSSGRGCFIITPAGIGVVKDNPPVIDNAYLMKFPNFKRFKNPIFKNRDVDDSGTPDDTLEESFEKINENLIDDILHEIIKISPQAFEQMVVDLLAEMGYGTFKSAGKVTPVTGDEGIDGIIMEDKLGFNLIYIQVKKWDLNSTVGRPAIQSFVGAINDKDGKGLFVTTAIFSKQAVEYAKRQHIVLIDGIKLASLMIEHNFGVRVEKIFEVKIIDQDVLDEYFEV
jgi:restriction system protein